MTGKTSPVSGYTYFYFFLCISTQKKKENEKYMNRETRGYIHNIYTRDNIRGIFIKNRRQTKKEKKGKQENKSRLQSLVSVLRTGTKQYEVLFQFIIQNCYVYTTTIFHLIPPTLQVYN